MAEGDVRRKLGKCVAFKVKTSGCTFLLSLYNNLATPINRDKRLHFNCGLNDTK